MVPRSGLTYIIVNRKTRLVLDDPVGKGGFVSVNRLSEDDTQKVRHTPYPIPTAAHTSQWMLFRGQDGLWTLQNARNGKFLSIQEFNEEGGDAVIAKHGDTQACRWSIIPEDSISFR